MLEHSHCARHCLGYLCIVGPRILTVLQHMAYCPQHSQSKGRKWGRIGVTCLNLSPGVVGPQTPVAVWGLGHLSESATRSGRTLDTCSPNTGSWLPRGHRNRVGLLRGQWWHLKNVVTYVSIVRAGSGILEGRPGLHTTKYLQNRLCCVSS